MIRLLCVLAALSLFSTAWAAPAPQPFDSGWDKPLDPSRDCKIRRNNGVLTIELPGREHAYDPTFESYNAPRLLRDIDGDFTMQVRVRITPCAADQLERKDCISFTSAGFLVIPPEGSAFTCVSLEYRIPGQGLDVDSYRVNFHRFVRSAYNGGSGYSKDFGQWPFKVKQPEHVYLRLERRNNEFIHSISSDGKSWVSGDISQFSRIPPKLKVGLAAYETEAKPSKVRFDQFRLLRGKKKR